jgi:tetratricopeptide (TPR) repeat protein
MNRIRLVSSRIMALMIVPALCSAQSQGSPPPTANETAIVSLRDLSIPKKASKAFNKGTRLLAAKNWDGSISEFQLAIEAFPAFYEAYYRMGIADAELNRRADAESAFRKSIELSEGRYAPPHFGLAMILTDRKEQLAEAETTARTGLALDPADAAGHFTLAWILYATDRLPDAEKSARQAVMCQPDLAAAYLLLAKIHQRESNPSAVAEDLDSYSRLDPGGPESASAKDLRKEAQRRRTREDAGSVVAEANP